MRLEVLLGVVSPSLLKSGDTRFLLIQGYDGQYSLPSDYVGEHQSTLEVAAAILEYHTGLKARIMGVGWVDLAQCPLYDSVDRVVDGNRVIGVPYGAMLPGELVEPKSPHAKWVSLGDAFSSKFDLDHFAVLQGICNVLTF